MPKISNETRLLLDLAEQQMADSVEAIGGGTYSRDYRQGYHDGFLKYEEILDSIVKDLEE